MKKMLMLVLLCGLFLVTWFLVNKQEISLGNSFSWSLCFYDQEKVLPQILMRHYDVVEMQKSIIKRVRQISDYVFPDMCVRPIDRLLLSFCEEDPCWHIIIGQKFEYPGQLCFLYAKGNNYLLDDVNRSIPYSVRVDASFFNIEGEKWKPESPVDGYSKGELVALHSFSHLLGGAIEKYIAFYRLAGDDDKVFILEKELDEIGKDWRMAYLPFFLEKEGFSFGNTQIEIPLLFLWTIFVLVQIYINRRRMIMIIEK